MKTPNQLPRLRTLVRSHWRPKPIRPPKPDPNLKNLTGAQRSAEVIRFSVLSLELWISPLGKLREWVRLNSTVSAILIVPAVLVLPLVLLITGQLAQWLALLISIAGRLIVFPVVALIAAGVITLTIILVRTILSK